MFTFNISLLPDGTVMAEKGLKLKREDLDLSALFTDEPVTVAFELNHQFDRVYAKVQASATASLDCSLCLKPFEKKLGSSFMVLFEPRPEAATQHGADPEDPEENVAFFDGDILPLGEEIRQELELQVPYRPLCRENCAGLCPRCGADLNAGPCGCDLSPQDGPFSSLKGLLDTQDD
jgi:uncharacterized protein